VARGYEWLFWAAAGVLVMTGVGNLGAFGSGLPEPDTRWGTTLVVKLSSVFVLIVLSVPRTLAVGALVRERPATARRLGFFYGVTAAALALILGIAILLAHG
jgi:putative copper export protein